MGHNPRPLASDGRPALYGTESRQQYLRRTEPWLFERDSEKRRRMKVAAQAAAIKAAAEATAPTTDNKD